MKNEMKIKYTVFINILIIKIRNASFFQSELIWSEWDENLSFHIYIYKYLLNWFKKE
jgi:hypothetical protein